MGERDWIDSLAPYAGIIFFGAVIASCFVAHCEIRRIGYVTTDTPPPPAEAAHDQR